LTPEQLRVGAEQVRPKSAVAVDHAAGVGVKAVLLRRFRGPDGFPTVIASASPARIRCVAMPICGRLRLLRD
jgi:hypothetical protein